MLYGIFIVLLILKLTSTVDWSWWIITIPLWVPAGAYVLVLLTWIAGIFGFAALHDGITKFRRKQRWKK